MTRDHKAAPPMRGGPNAGNGEERSGFQPGIRDDMTASEMRLLEALADELGVLVWVARPDAAEALFVNSRYEQVFGAPPAAALGDGWIQSVHPEDRDKVLRTSEDAGPGGFDLTFRIVRPDGAVRWVRARRVTAIPGAGSPRELVMGITEDVTDERAAGLKLRRSEEYLRLTQSVGRLGGWTWDFSSGRIERTPECYAAHEMPPGSLGDSAERYLAFVHPEDQAAMRLSGEAVMRGETRTVRYRFMHPDGRVLALLGQSGPAETDAAGRPVKVIGTVQNVSELSAAQSRAREAAERFEAFFAHAPSQAYMWRRRGADFVLETMNLAAVERHGQEAAALIDAKASEFFAGQPEWLEDLRRCADERVSFQAGREVVVDGRAIQVSFTWVPPDAVVVRSVPVPDEELVARELASYFRRVPLPAYLWKAVGDDLVLADVNEAGVQLSGLGLSSLVGRRASEFFAERPDVERDLRRCLGGDTFTREFEYTLRGTARESTLIATYVHLSDDTVAAHVRDVTADRQTHRQLVDSRTVLRTVLDASPNPILKVDAEGRIIEANEAFADLLGVAREGLIGQDIFEAAPADVNVLRPGALQQVVRTGQPLEIEAQSLERRFDSALYPILSDGGVKSVVVYAEDTTARRQADMARTRSHDLLRSLTRHLEDAREIERAEIARDLHDELGSMLSALKLEIEVLARRRGGDPDLSRLAGLIQEGIDAGRRLIGRLRPEVLDDLGLVPALEWLGKEAAGRAGLRCTFDFPAEEPSVAEPAATALFRVAQEALTNVVRHAEAGSVRIGLAERENVFLLEVHDDGKGFERSEVPPSSFGILGITERVSALGGTASIKSAPGRGTTVRVRLPRL